jgi:phosphoribosyl 1,2-cyclic phosphodiesterase
VKIKFWGTRGSLATPGPEMARYGGNTSCVGVEGRDGTLLVLDAGTGIRPLGASLERRPRRIDILLTHLHLDHIQGLGFFEPLRWPETEAHIWGPASPVLDLRSRLSRYLSPPLFPVLLRDLPCQLTLHEVPRKPFEVGELRVTTAMVCHPGPTVGYRVQSPEGSVTYIPDHEPALCGGGEWEPRWTSGHDIAADTDILIHDSQYTHGEYQSRVGWGHSTYDDAIRFATLTGVRRLVPFHHDPGRDDNSLERAIAEVVARTSPRFPVTPAAEGQVLVLGQDS